MARSWAPNKSGSSYWEEDDDDFVPVLRNRAERSFAEAKKAQKVRNDHRDRRATQKRRVGAAKTKGFSR